MDYLKVLITSFVSLAVLFLLTKIMGNKQMSQLNLFDYITGITIGSIAAEAATELEGNFFIPLISMVVYALVTLIISVYSEKSFKGRRFFDGRALVLYNNGSFYKKNMKTARMDVHSFLQELRNKGFFDISQVETAVFEENGTVSVLPKSNFRPLTPNDMSIQPSRENLIATVIADGIILKNNLEKMGRNEAWLNKELKNQGQKELKEIMLATLDREGNLSVYRKNKEKEKDILN